MKIKTRICGEIEVDDSKVVDMLGGLIGFESLNKFILINEDDENNKKGVLWLQSVDEENLALPTMDPSLVYASYAPTISDEILQGLGDFDKDEYLVLVTLTVPKKIEDMTVNLKAPIVIDVDTMRACQVIIDDEDCPVKFPIYDILKKKESE
ncbi:MAG: flagellar assembly protein FliW [Lachnospiraceae bacterium]|jgi:flagellar assembly factor FliW|nr:flagellar assembly protein FliW [Lachnospiraceae bacterium]